MRENGKFLKFASVTQQDAQTRRGYLEETGQTDDFCREAQFGQVDSDEKARQSIACRRRGWFSCYLEGCKTDRWKISWMDRPH